MNRARSKRLWCNGNPRACWIPAFACRRTYQSSPPILRQFDFEADWASIAFKS